MSMVPGVGSFIHFGPLGQALPKWRDDVDDFEDDDPDDEELAETPEDVIAILGFDPLED